MYNRTTRQRWMLTVPLLVSMAISYAGAMRTAQAATQDKIVIGQSADITSFDPTELRMGTYVLTNLLYNTLLRIDAEGKPHAELAESWNRSSDGKTLTLNLRKDVHFHDGKPLTSKDVIFSIDYAKNPINGANILPLAKLVESTETPDDYTLVLHLSSGSDAVLDLLDLLYIIDSSSPTTVKTKGNGTGPFKLSRYEPGQETVFVRNDKYWRTGPEIKRVTIRIIPDRQASLLQLQAGSIDFLPSIEQESAKHLKKEGMAIGIGSAEGRVLDLTLNIRKPPLDNPKVRRAIRLALDRDRIAQDIAGSTAYVKCLPWPQYVLKQEKTQVDACLHDLAEAKKLISESGASGSSITIMSRSQSEPEIGSMAQILQNTLTEIGLKASINEMSEAAYISNFRKGDFQLAAHAFGRAGRTPATIISSAVIFKAKDNLAGFDSPEYQQNSAIVTTHPAGEQSSKALEKINTLLLDENWVIPVTTLPVLWAAKPTLSGVSFTLDGMPILEHAYFSK